MVQIDFSPQLSAAIIIKDGGHNFRYEITEHSLAKITPAPQATQGQENICSILTRVSNCDKLTIAFIIIGGHCLFREAKSCPREMVEENSELRGTDDVQVQI